MGSICSILSGTCVDSSMPLPLVPEIVSDASDCLGSSGTSALSPETASVPENAPLGIILLVGSISAVVTRFVEKCIGGLVRCATTGGDPSKAFPSLRASYSSPFLSELTGCEEREGPTGWPLPEAPLASTASQGVAVPFRSLESGALCGGAHCPRQDLPLRGLLGALALSCPGAQPHILRLLPRRGAVVCQTLFPGLLPLQ